MKKLIVKPALLKAHVKGYTRKDGTFVAEHDDKRPSAAPKPFAMKSDKWGGYRVDGHGHASYFKSPKAAEEHAARMNAVHAAGRMDEMHAASLKIAKKHTPFESLETKNSDREDFRETSRGGIKDALHEAYVAGGGKPGKKADAAVAEAHKHHLSDTHESLEMSNTGEDFKQTSKWGLKAALDHAFARGHEDGAKAASAKSAVKGALYDKDDSALGPHKVGDTVSYKGERGTRTGKVKGTRDGKVVVEHKAGYTELKHHSELFPSAPMKKSLLVVRPDLLKAHVKGYTRKDGTFVKEHDDKRQAAAPQDHPSASSVAAGLKAGYGETHYKSAATGATHVVKHDGKHYRSGMMRSESLPGLLHLIDKKVNNKAPATGKMTLGADPGGASPKPAILQDEKQKERLRDAAVRWGNKEHGQYGTAWMRENVPAFLKEHYNIPHEHAHAAAKEWFPTEEEQLAEIKAKKAAAPKFQEATPSR